MSATAAGLASGSGAERGGLLAGIYLGGLGWCAAFPVFAAALHQSLRARQDETTALLAGVGLAGGLLNAAAINVYLCFAALAVLRADPPALFRDASLVANAFTGFASAVCVMGFSLGLRRLGFPRWLLALAGFVALHHLVSAASLAEVGLFSPSGPVSASAPLGMTLWVGGVGALAWLRRERL